MIKFPSLFDLQSHLKTSLKPMKIYYFSDIITAIHKGFDITPQTFGAMLSSQSRLEKNNHKVIELSTVSALLKQLTVVNLSKLLVCLILFILNLGLIIASPFVIDTIANFYLKKDEGRIQIELIVVLIIGFKMTNAVVFIFGDFAKTSLGFQFFAFLYWHILDLYSQSGMMSTKINLLEYDCNTISNIVYSALTAFFYFAQIMVLFALLLQHLRNSQSYTFFTVLVLSFIVSQISLSCAAFIYNRRYISQKDLRLKVNISQHNDESLRVERGKQLKVNKQFLVVRMVSRMVSILFPILLNIFIFLVVDPDTIKDQQYTILILVNLIRSPIAQLMTAMNLNAQILNSCQRIVRVIKTPLQHNPSIQSQLIPEQPQIHGLMQNPEKGQIKFTLIWKTLRETLTIKLRVVLVLTYLVVLGTKFYGHYVTQHLLARTSTLQHYIGLGLQLLSPFCFYFLLIIAIQKVAMSLLGKLKKKIDYQTLNRISGDISAVDRAITIHSFEISYSLSAILGSYIYAIVSLGIWWLQIILISFIVIVLAITYKLNRFIMRSRRQVFRYELALKSTILKGLIEGQQIHENVELRNNWKKIFECKEMGLFIENYFMALVSIIILGLSLLMVLLGNWLVEEPVTKSVLLMACLSIDFDMMTLFFAMVRAELSLVSFQRVLNCLLP